MLARLSLYFISMLSAALAHASEPQIPPPAPQQLSLARYAIAIDLLDDGKRIIRQIEFTTFEGAPTSLGQFTEMPVARPSEGVSILASGFSVLITCKRATNSDAHAIECKVKGDINETLTRSEGPTSAIPASQELERRGWDTTVALIDGVENITTVGRYQIKMTVKKQSAT